jgi:predicted XRE-type DNA-binding protein
MNDDLELIHGGGNVFDDLGLPGADLEQLRVLLAAQILEIMDKRKLPVRQLAEASGVDASDFSRIRQAKLGRFTIDRLMTILSKLDQSVEVAVTVTPRNPALSIPGLRRPDQQVPR